MICDPDMIEQHARMYRQGAEAVIGRVPAHDDSAPGFLSDSVRRWIDSEKVGSPLSQWDIYTGQLSVRTAVFDALGGFDERYTTDGAFSNEDADFGVRLLEKHQVRHNPLAISRQRYFVGPQEYMARIPKMLEGDLHFLRKHPQLSSDLLERRGVNSVLGRYVFIPISRVPVACKLVPAMAAAAAGLALRTPLRSSRLIARLFSGACCVAYWAAFQDRCALPGHERLLVLCYHAIEDQSADPVLAPYGVAPGLFADHLDTLAAAGFTFVSAETLAHFFEYGMPLPKRPVLLTFDDCYADLLAVARDVLQPRAIPALAFAVTGMKSGTNEWDQVHGAATLPLLSGSQLQELARLGVEIGSHSRTHRDMTSLEPLCLEEETQGSADDLEAAGLPRPRFFAYPFGIADVSSRKSVEKAGYLAAFGCNSDVLTGRNNHFLLPRVGVFAGDRGWRYSAKIRSPHFLARIGKIRHGLASKLRKAA